MPVLQDGELVLYGFVGDSYWGEGFTASEVLAALAVHGRDNEITVRINSGGGYIDDGIAIYNSLIAHRGKVRVEVDAMAASSASIIAMAGDDIIMKAGSIMMIHDPANITFGTVADHEKSIEQLTAQATQMASIYAERSGQDDDAVRDQMKAETWMTADEAVSNGYADSVEKAKARAIAAFDFRSYAKAPERLKTLSKRHRWSFETDERTAASADDQPRQHKEKSMTDKTEAGTDTAAIEKAKTEAAAEAATAAVTAYKERRKTVLALDEAKGREALAEHLIDTDMSVEAIKATLAVAPAPEAPEADEPQTTGTTDPAPSVADYERQRLNGEGLNGGGKTKAAAPSLAANMRKLLGKEVA
ncbi:Clp protease [Acuticoccus sediminis]|uniref:ATP-dependent Clp protease proteolytic subunit n=1 Tax=Acuticoccus sediminis TaxID=2184697 RepID=A0A8B2NST2_9HYPH|nr:head maturation protease, ClpP-related [Acuticoccus sediminis]RAI01109.1 Clp protease [Acuticoccus sediminis]